MTNDSRYIIFAINTVKRLSECIIQISKIPTTRNGVISEFFFAFPCSALHWMAVVMTYGDSSEAHVVWVDKSNAVVVSS